MWSEILLNYGIFILEVITLLLIVVGIFALIVALRHKNNNSHATLKITNLAEQQQEHQDKLSDFRLSEIALKQKEKARKAKEKAEQKAQKAKYKHDNTALQPSKPCLYVLNFKGDLAASQAEALAQSINAVIACANTDDEVLLRLESPGGLVHAYGYASSQLNRLKQHGIKLTVAVDKVAASGGYMMACVADKIVAAPFAVIGSVGVVAQIPNIHRLLKKHDVDVEVMTAGEYKRTMTVLGENTDKDREKFQQELNETHQLFKDFVVQHRPHLAIDNVATGEHWFGQQALTLGLVDELATSDDIILNAMKEKDVLEVRFNEKKSLLQKIGKQAEMGTESVLHRLLNRTLS
ncbi:protease SohB [Spirabiliibacterium falconis]|uniref:protease SohB n=1 Tax=Spirabiliibacterium falconis TaxID=572023 RepID=UPI001AAD40E9|nr:protease SohB [Spirabiliibacterium falconis]MBE2894075.1 protease SohB [Spirabiliibacterium falconis]